MAFEASNGRRRRATVDVTLNEYSPQSRHCALRTSAGGLEQHPELSGYISVAIAIVLWS